MLQLRKCASASKFPAVLLCIGMLSFSTGSLAQKVYDVAGGYVGDGGQATSSDLAYPLFAAFDQTGNLYISDDLHCRLRKVDTQGNISTLAGTGVCGYSGDGGPANHAKISHSYGIAVDAAGDVFFVDNLRIREVDASGKISTVAGKGVDGYCGDGGPALKACFAYPCCGSDGLAVSGSDLYIADTYNNRIRKVSGGVIATVAGNGVEGYAGDGGPATQASLSSPQGVAFYSPTQTLWISDSSNNVIRRVNSGTISTWWGDGNCEFDLQHLCYPGGIALDSGGDLFVADTENNRVLGAKAQGGIVVLEAGGQGQGYNGDGIPATSAMLNQPNDVAVDGSGDILTVDTGNFRARSGGAFQNIATVAGGCLGDGGQALQSGLNTYWGGAISFDAVGNLYIADSADYRVRKVLPTGIITTFAGTGITGYSGDGGPATGATMNAPDGVALDQYGNVFISDRFNKVVRKVDSTGTITSFGGPPYGELSGLAPDSSGNVYVAAGSCLVWKITPSGLSSIVAGVPNHCGFNSDGIPGTQSWLNLPQAVALDSAGNLYIADLLNFRIRKVNSQGIISTVAGDGTFGCGTTGDGGPATAAPLCDPSGVALDAAGNLYIADLFNIRVVSSSGIIQTLVSEKANTDAHAIAVSPSGVVHFLDYPGLVRKVQTATASVLVSSQNPSMQGQPVTFTATVTGSTGTNPVGTVAFKAGTKSLGKQTLSGGKASVTTSTLPKGANTITATFNGGTDFASSSASLIQTVN